MTLVVIFIFGLVFGFYWLMGWVRTLSELSQEQDALSDEMEVRLAKLETLLREKGEKE